MLGFCAPINNSIFETWRGTMGIISECWTNFDQCAQHHQIILGMLLVASLLTAWGGIYKLNEWAHTGKFDWPPERPGKRQKTTNPTEPGGMI
jgi:hypothetical protein